MTKKNVFAICGSTRDNSANLQLIKAIAQLFHKELEFEIYNELASLPHFNPDLDKEDVHPAVQELRNKIAAADGVLICTPEYVFSLPGSLKNAIEWTVSTTVFSEKPVALITASSLGEKAHEALQLIMKTLYARFSEPSQLLISGVRTKVNNNGEITDATTLKKINELMAHFIKQLHSTHFSKEL